MTGYHSTFMPLADIYQLAGPEIFKRLAGKDGTMNRIILTQQIVNEVNSSRGIAQGGREVIDHLKTLPIRREDELIIYSANESLEVFYHEKASESLKAEYFPTVITTNSKDHIHFSYLGFEVEAPRFLLAHRNITHEGMIVGNDELLEGLRNLSDGKRMPLETAQSILGRGELFQNQFIKMVDPRTRSKVYARVTGDLERTPEGVITSIKNPGLEFVATSGPISYRGLGLESIFGIKPKTPEQFLAVQYGLFNPDIDLVFICGGHGSGKTLLSYTCAVAEISDYQASGKGSSSRFNQMVLLKPNDAVGGNRRDVGALPGTLWEKLSQTLKPFENAHDYHKSDLRKFNFSEMVKHPIHSGTYGKRSFDGKFGNGWNLPKERPAIELLSFAEVRGISLEDTLIIIDEAQNFTPYELKTICERPSANTKLVILGDPAQFDNPFCSLDFNGLTCAITHYIREPYTALFEFDTNFRSPVSRHAASWKAYSQ